MVKKRLADIFSHTYIYLPVIADNKVFRTLKKK